MTERSPPPDASRFKNGWLVRDQTVCVCSFKVSGWLGWSGFQMITVPFEVPAAILESGLRDASDHIAWLCPERDFTGLSGRLSEPR